MLIKKPADILPSAITPHSVFLRRREFLRTSALTGAGLALAGGLLGYPLAGQAASKLANVKKTAYNADPDPLTPLADISAYNNFYEFGTGKEDPAVYARDFKPHPWSVEIGGDCAKPGVYQLEDFIAPHQLEERIYRLRCVEAWSMVIPWVGIALGDLLKRFEPGANAKYVAFTTLYDPERMPGQRIPVLEWPYIEGLRMDEAMHPLTILAVGLYGETLPNQNGAPLRLVVPWKYGFKSIKSIVKISFTEKQPPTTWNRSAPGEYGFYSNVNPQVDHPRWSQGKERRIGELFKRPTLPFNGYAEAVAAMYAGMDLQTNY